MDHRSLLVQLVPAKMGQPPAPPAAATGPNIEETAGEKGKSSTYENRDTLNSLHDEDLFDYYAMSQIAIVDADRGSIVPLGNPDKFESLDAAPDGKHILVTSIHKPYSYITTYDRFPQEVAVWDVSDPNKISIHHVASVPLVDRVPIHGVPVGPRQFSWRSTAPATLLWAEALDGGDWNVATPFRDKVMMQKAPFMDSPVEIAKLDQHYTSLLWGTDPNIALLSEFDQNRHWRKTFIIDVDHPAENLQVVWDLSADEKYANPGTPVRRLLPNGAPVMVQDGDSIFLSGIGSSPDGDRPFLDRLDLKTLKSERLFRSDKSDLDQFLSFLGPDPSTFLTWHQSPKDPPNAFISTLRDPIAAPAAGEAVFMSVRR